ncbi:sensor domain-containing diguanylate cyclase [Nocardia noduli]|uniref:sensor domain-containing diguanylate cyclase n=1 Tax=Nocardia noduli TaxID=2815722 RepID=UPI0027E058F4|nr:sensor domain-containing diguanylate cyclase [Nocardia noduli]
MGESIETAGLAGCWWQTLSDAMDLPIPDEPGRLLLRDLVIDLLTALDAEPFDATVGSRVGAELADARLGDDRVPALSARVLADLVGNSVSPDATVRFAVLVTALGQGYQRREHALRTGRTDPTGHDAGLHRDARFRVLFDSPIVAVAFGDLDGNILDANPALAEMIGTSVEELRGISVYDFAHPDDRADISTLLYEQLVPAREGSVTLRHRLLRTDGTVGRAAFVVTYIRGTGRQPDYLGAVGAEITEWFDLEDDLHRQARHDPLTGLPNRRYLLEQITSMSTANASETDRVGICFADIDHFKDINDRYGHDTGDKVLTAVASGLRDLEREFDCFIARLGGDEFVALIAPPADTDRVGLIAHRLSSVVSIPITVNDHRLNVSVSIGAAVTPVAGVTAETLLRTADSSLHEAKARGRGQWIVHTPSTSSR